MHITLINHYAGSPQHGMEFRPHQLAARWVELGHDVTIAAGSWSHLRNQNPSVTNRVTEERIDGIRYRWYKTNSYKGNGLGRLWTMRQFTRHINWDRNRFFKSNPPDCVIASSTYPFDMWPAKRLADTYGTPLIWEVHDLWPLSQIELYGFSRLHPFIMLTQHAEGMACRCADHVVSILPKAIDHLRTRGLSDDRYVHIPNGISTRESEKALQEAPLEEACTLIDSAKEQGRTVVMYAGGHAPNHDLETLLACAKHLKERPFTFILIGDGPSKESLVRQAREQKLDHVHFLERTTRSRALATLARSDLLYAGIAEGSLYRFGIGLNKIFDAMFVGTPILGVYTSGNDPVAEAECGFSVPAGDAEAATLAIEELHAMTENERQLMGQSGRRYVTTHHDYDRLAISFLDVMEANIKNTQ